MTDWVFEPELKSMLEVGVDSVIDQDRPILDVIEDAAAEEEAE